MRRVWHKMRSAHLREHPSGHGIIERQSVPALIGVPLVVFGGAAIGAFSRAFIDPDYVPMFETAVAAGTLGAAVLLAIFRIEIEVSGGQLIFGFWPFYTRRIALAEVRNWEPVTIVPVDNQIEHKYDTYRTMMGAAIGRENRHGLRLTLKDGRTLLIGTAHPERLAHAIAAGKFGAGAS